MTLTLRPVRIPLSEDIDAEARDLAALGAKLGNAAVMASATRLFAYADELRALERALQPSARVVPIHADKCAYLRELAREQDG